MSFKTFLSELETLAKSLTGSDAGSVDANDNADDAKIAAAAADGAAAGEGEDGKKKEGEAGEAGAPVTDAAAGKPDEEVLGKALKVTLASGEEVEAVDGTELVKSLMGRLDISEDALAKAFGVVSGNVKAVEDKLAKATAIIEAQDKLIKSLSDRVEAIANTGKGRRAVVSVTDKVVGADVLAKSEPSGMDPHDFMLKAMDAMKAGRITGEEVARAETYLNRGIPLPEGLIKKVAA